MEELKIDQNFLTVLTGIEEEFFKKHREKENERFTISELGLKAIK
jgi:hypothetical protein